MRRLTEEEREISKERQREYFRQYLKTPLGRAHDLLGTYRVEDRKRGRGECTLTAQWIVDNIFTKPCVHCGETDWRKIGCNRLDNSKPHTEDNVEPCCMKCNNQLGSDERKRKIYQYTLDGELVKIWDSKKELMDDGEFNPMHVDTCCKGGRFDKRYGKWYPCRHHKGYRWSYTPL